MRKEGEVSVVTPIRKGWEARLAVESSRHEPLSSGVAGKRDASMFRALARARWGGGMCSRDFL